MMIHLFICFVCFLQGKDRYPYPVGYHAIRTHIGVGYKMEINEGRKGPLFMVTSTVDGEWCSGTSSESACEGLWKRGGVHAKLAVVTGKGRRLSSKVDGIELFGFKNQLVLRLLRQLVSNVITIPEPILLSPGFSNRVEALDLEFQPYLVEAKSRKKRSRIESWLYFNDENCHTFSPSEEDKQDHKYLVAPLEQMDTTSFVNNKKNPIAAEESSLLEYPKLNNVSQETDFLQGQRPADAEDSSIYSVAKHLDRSGCANTQVHTSIIARNVAEETTTTSNPGPLEVFDDYVDDTLDLIQESCRESPYHMECIQVAPRTVVSGETGIDSLPEEESIPSSLSGNSERNEFGSIGQELAQSMMCLLLPQAVPLLKKKSSRKKRTTTGKSKISISEVGTYLDFACHKDNCVPYNDCEVNNPDKSEGRMPLEFSFKEKEKKELLNPGTSSNVHSFEDIKSVISDTFEDISFKNHPIHQSLSQSDILEADQASVDKREGNSVTSGLLECVRHVGIDENMAKDAVLTADYNLGRKETTLVDIFVDCTEKTESPLNNSRVDGIMDKQLNISPESNEDIRGTEPFMLIPNQSRPKCSIPDLVPAKEKSINLTSTPSSTTVIETTKREVCKPRFGQYYCRQRYKNRNSKIPNDSNDQLNPVPRGCQENVSTNGLLEASGISLPVLVTSDISLKEVNVKSSTLSPSNVSSKVHPALTSSITKHNFSHPENVVCKDTIHPDILSTTESSFTTEIGEAGPSNRIFFKDISYISEIKHNTPDSEIEVFVPKSLNSDDVKEYDVACFVNQSISEVIRPESEWKIGHGNIVELMGYFVHPAPILSLSLSTQMTNVHISVICGFLADKARTIFIYKVPIIEDPKGRCPSLFGHSLIMLPDSKETFSREISVERSGLQFTPDGQYLVIPNSIKVPLCRERNLHCLCSICTSYCYKESAVNIVHVKLGYVSIVAKLTTDESVHCVLVCEPKYLIAVEESGMLHVWVMNSKWCESIEEFGLPSLDYTSPCIEELKGIPNYAPLVIGHNGMGEFVLWDISKRVILSRFSSLGSSVSQVLPVGLFAWQSERVASFSVSLEDHIKEIMAASQTCFSKSMRSFPFSSANGEDIGVWLLVSVCCDSDSRNDNQESGVTASSNESWRLALLVKDTVILGSALDPRASSVNVLEGFGIIGTSNGLVYMWELSTGMNLTNLHQFEYGNVSCITADPQSGLLAVAGEEGKIVMYAVNFQGI